jgi:hypothetical protein
MIFEISGGERGRRSFCGVEEFTAPEDHVIVPQWILDNLQAEDGVRLQVQFNCYCLSNICADSKGLPSYRHFPEITTSYC